MSVITKTSNSRELIAEARLDILRMYLDETDTRPWAVAWSGGKDSTCVMGLLIGVLEAIPEEKRTRHVYAVMSDTVMENPNLETYMHGEVAKLNEYAAKKGLPISAEIVSRPVEQSYFVLTLGRGYFLPQNNGKGRWCTERLKITPQDEALRKINPSYVLVGVRNSESTSREASIKKWSISEKIGNHVSLSDTKTFMPIVNFTVEDVWHYLSTEGVAWGSTAPVRTLYREATGECGFTNPKGVEKKSVEVCGARFGCWNCPVITNDRSTEKMSETHRWMEPLGYWRELQLKVYGSYIPPRPEGQSRKDRSAVLKRQREINERIKRITKAGYNRKGVRMEDGQGTLTVEARKFLLSELIEVQMLVNTLRANELLPVITLISEDEITLIERSWAEDELNFPHLVTNSLGIPFENIHDLLDGKITEEEAVL